MSEICINCIETYFTYKLDQGLSITEIIETFKTPVLPLEIKQCQDKLNLKENDIRRCAQLVSTKYIIKYNTFIGSVMKL